MFHQLWSFSPHRGLKMKFSGEKWKKTRTILDPSFNTRALNDSILAVFNAKNEQMLQILKTECENKETYFNMRPYIYRLAIFSLYGEFL